MQIKKNNGLIFSGIQVLAAGSFVQLPPVPSVLDPGLFAFQSDMFAKTFPHKINLKTVVCQDEVDLLNAINELCLGCPSQQMTVTLMKHLRHPIVKDEQTVHIFGNNFDMDMYNHEILEKLQGNMQVIYAKDNGVKKTTEGFISK